MNRIEDLYQDIILEHNKNPKNYYKIKKSTHYAKGNNTFCGDELEIFCTINIDTIKKISFLGHGCAISKASASIMVNMLQKYTIKEAMNMFFLFHKFLTEKNNILDKFKPGKELLVFKGVQKFPLRIKCAMLPWYTLKSALMKK